MSRLIGDMRQVGIAVREIEAAMRHPYHVDLEDLQRDVA
jgi:hypothetical protein